MAVLKEEQIFLPRSYKPSEVEPYMNPMHLEFFRTQLLEKRSTLQEEWEGLNGDIHLSADSDTEIADRAGQDVILFTNIQRLEAIQKSINSIDQSLQDIQTKRYGFCKQTGRKIGIKRLLANPEAKLCVEVQEGIEIKNAEEE